MRYIFIITAFILNTTCSQAQKIYATSLSTLKSYMSGSFNSALQAKNDSDYYEIHLHMQPIWENTKEGFWLYVEQAMSTALSKPYRQRIYHVSIKNDSTIVSKV
ncbi:MAG: CpcT/CpeT family chromophore lyase, partial [Bacteroidota bacterium]